MKRTIVPTFCTLLLCTALFLPTATRATNMRVGPIVSPAEIIRMKQEIFIKYLMRNDSLYDAEGVKSIFTVRDVLTNTIVFQNEVTTPFIAAYTVLYVQSALAWIPQYAGRFRITVDLVYNQDVIPGDNSRSKEFRVEAPPIGIFNFYRYTLLSPFFAPLSQYGSLRLAMPSVSSTQWVNVFAWKNDSTPVWLAKNLPVPASGKPITYEHDLDLTDLVEPGIAKDSIVVSVTVTDTSWNTLTNELLKQGYILEHDTVAVGLGNELTTPVFGTPPAARPPTLARTPVLRETILRDTVPNIDLDSTLHNSGTTPGYAGDFNACVPTAIANSMQWLENFEDGLPQSLEIREKLKLLSALCNRPISTGVGPLAAVRAKQHYVDSLKIPLRVKFQANKNWIPKDSATIVSPLSKYGHSAANQSSDTGRVSMDWIVQEIKDSEDVEISFKFFDTVNNVIAGGHCVNVTGVITDNDRLRGLWYQDDLDQLAPGGTAQRYVSVDDNIDGRGPVIYGNQFGYRRFIHAAYSESYDPTVKFEEQHGSVGSSNTDSRLKAVVSNGILTVELPGEVRGAKLQIVDLAGHLVSEHTLSSSAISLEIDLRASGCPRGAYLLVLISEDRILSKGGFSY